MEQELTCPKCKGNKFSLVAKDTFKCAYCGNVFSTKQEEYSTHPKEQEKNLDQSKPQVIFVQNPPQKEEKQNNESNTGDYVLTLIIFTVAVVAVFFLISLVIK
jgi:uncharacterized Zn finger protein (UPF0148 family)